MNDERNAASGSSARMPAMISENRSPLPQRFMRAQQSGRRVLQREVEVGNDRLAARASSRRAGPSPRTGRGRAGARARGRAARSGSRRRSSGASEPGSPTSRPYHARSCATSTISAAPCSTSARTSASIDSGVRERCLPRNDGMAQNAHARSQPSATFTYAQGALGAGRGSSSRSRTPAGLRPRSTTSTSAPSSANPTTASASGSAAASSSP